MGLEWGRASPGCDPVLGVRFAHSLSFAATVWCKTLPNSAPFLHNLAGIQQCPLGPSTLNHAVNFQQ